VELEAEDEKMSLINLECLAIKQAFSLFENEDGSRMVLCV